MLHLTRVKLLLVVLIRCSRGRTRVRGDYRPVATLNLSRVDSDDELRQATTVLAVTVETCGRVGGCAERRARKAEQCWAGLPVFSDVAEHGSGHPPRSEAAVPTTAVVVHQPRGVTPDETRRHVGLSRRQRRVNV
ncbi:hypothetical protein HPB52_017094 [Rhipicephalus sanguineus]|uniref:Secreted protein n=1 Tax=Rhipicephalus sanguineus TaxID=34632 RepID=A0A9D4PKB8_RHISA|nr:hypothetical protein HPB52_017094 [Rhipicephalus sanguineus]